MTTMKFNLFALKRRLELLKNKPYTWQEISAQTGVHWNTLYNLSYNKTRRLDLDILTKLYDFFRQEGLSIELNDLFAVGANAADHIAVSESVSLAVTDTDK